MVECNADGCVGRNWNGRSDCALYNEVFLQSVTFGVVNQADVFPAGVFISMVPRPCSELGRSRSCSSPDLCYSS